MNLEQPTKTYKSERSLAYSCQYHVIWCPKCRRKVLVPPVDERLKELILEKQPDYGYEVLEMEIMQDHVHLVLDVSPLIGINKVVGQIKGYTSHQIREEFPFMKKRLPTLWTRSRFISSVGAVSLEVVKQYIQNQKNV